MVFGDQSGQINRLCTTATDDVRFNSFSRDTEFPDIPSQLPNVPMNDMNFPLASIPLPLLTSGSRWFSDFPNQLLEYRFVLVNFTFSMLMNNNDIEQVSTSNTN